MRSAAVGGFWKGRRTAIRGSRMAALDGFATPAAPTCLPSGLRQLGRTESDSATGRDEAPGRDRLAA